MTKKVLLQWVMSSPRTQRANYTHCASPEAVRKAGAAAARSGRCGSKPASRLLFAALQLGLFLSLHSISATAQSTVPACLYALDGSASGALNISGSTSITTNCSVAVESTSSTAFEMSGTEILYVQNNVQVGVVGGWSLSGQTKIVNQSTGQTVQPVKITSPSDPLSYLPAPTTGTVVGKTPTDYDMNNKPPNNTLSPGVYCGGLTIGNTNGATFTMSPGTYIMAGGGLTINSLGIVNGSGVTVYNTSASSSNMWGCAKTYSYTPITISGQANVTLSAPTSGALANVVFFGDRAGCSKAGSCTDQINGGASTNLSGALYFKTDTLLISGNNSSKGCMTAVADMITFNGNSSVVNACSGVIGGVTVSVSPTTAALYAAQTQQFTATVTNATSTGVNWSISAAVGSINSSGLYTAPSTVTSTQTVTVTATSQADLSVAGTATITLAVPPSITASMSPSPNAAGWNNSTVTVTFTCTAGTYPIKTCPSPVQVTTQGANQQICGQAVDTNGAKSASACVTVSLDETPPTIAATPTPAPDSSGWNNTDVTVNFACSDSLSGISVCPSPIFVSAAGANQVIKGTATDKAGNTAMASTMLNVELTLPSIAAAVSPAPNSNYWNNSSVTVTFTCTPSLSPITNCAAPQTISTQGANQVVSGTVTDAANNTNTAKVTLNIATTPPHITASVSPAPNSSGWNDTPVTVTFTCTATTAPLATCPQPQTVNTPGANQVITGTATDVAGNSVSASVTLNIGTKPPTITGAVAPAANSAGWNNTSVTVTWTCTVGTAPISSCPSPTTVSTQGSNQTVTGTVTDIAGNSASANVTLSIDETAPTISPTVSPSPDASGWNNSAVTVTFTCSDSLSGVASCPPPQTVSTAGAGQVISGTVTSVAGNTATAQVTVNISLTSPTITAIVSPQPNSSGWNNSNVTVSFLCTAGGAPIVSCSNSQVVSTEGSSIPITGSVIDAAGASNTVTVVVKLDKTPPAVTASLSPSPNSNGWNTSPVTVSFDCSDSLSGVATCPGPTTISTSGANQTVSGTAFDVAGNVATVTAKVNLELSLPTITASVSPSPNAVGWNNSSVTVSFNCQAAASPITSCSPNQTVSTQGVGQVISGMVQDQAGNQGTTSVTLNIDLTPPLISQLSAPSQLSPGASGTASLTVTDLAPIASVVFALNGSPIGTVMSPPYTTTVAIPSNAVSGSTYTLTATVTDVAGNTATSSKGIQVVASGVIVGEVLSDTTGLPLPGASVQVIGQSGQNATSDSQGQYSIPVTSSQLFLSISQPGNSGSGTPAMVTVQRQVAVQSGVGTVPVDTRLTTLAAPTTITASGGTVGTGAITLTVPPSGATTQFYLTPLSQQGLPGLLPLGWSPVAAFDLQTNISTAAALSANFTGLPAGILYLVSYSYNVSAWNMVTPNLTVSNGSLTVPLPSTGDYALVVPDAGNAGIQIPAVGQPLTGVAMVTLPTNATSTGSLSPGNIAPTGGTSTASLAVQSSTPLPSGTVIQSQVIETYKLTSGQLISDEPRYEDILLYQSPAPPSGSAVGASFPVTPSQTFQVSQLTSGDVHLNILSGRESVRGQTGGSDLVAVQSGDATLTIAAGSLPQDTAIAVAPESVDTFLPSTNTLVPLSEYNVNLSDQVLSNAAQLSVGTAGATPGSNVVVAQEQRVGGVPYLVVVAMAQVTTTNIVSLNTPGLPGINQGGDYVFYELNLPTGFVSGTVSTGSGPVAAMVQTDGLPFVAFANSNGNYMVAAAAGTVNLAASIANTALAGTATVQVTAGQTATANLTVAGQVESATITPANGALGVPLTAEIDVTAAEGFNQSTVTSSTVVLTAAGSSTPVPLRFVFSGGGNTLAVFPQSALQPSTQYTFQASGLANAVGGLISVPTTSFTTAAITPPTYNTNALVFAMPDSNGNVAISAPAGSVPAGSTILIVDQTNGVVYSLTVFNDGSVTGEMPATINDLLQITFTDPAGNVTNFTVSQFVAADGTTAVGPGGGTVTGPGGTGIIIPAGALPQGVTFKLTQLDQTAFPTLPTWQGANFGSGLRITDPAMPTFKKEAKLAFPVPANAPSNAFYYVYRRLTDQNGNTYFETIDEAFVQGSGASAQVVTASPPFCGYHNSYGSLTIQAGGSPLPLTLQDQDYFVMWDVSAQAGPSGSASQGLIVGLATQVVPAVPGVSAATTEPAQSVVSIFLTPPQGSQPSNFAIYDATCATFTIFDPQLGGGARSVTASQLLSTGSTTLQATAYEVDGAQSDDGLYAIYAGLEDLYANIGRVSFLFPAPTPPLPPAQINIGIVNATTGAPVTGIVQSGTPLTITFSSNLTVQSVSINGAQCDGIVCPTLMGATPPANPVAGMNYYQLSASYTPNNPGVTSITATAVNPLTASPVTVTQGFLVVLAGGGNTTLTATGPIIVSSIPPNNAQNVSIEVSPVVTFSEPVTNIVYGPPPLVNNVTLVGANAGDTPTLNLIGIRADGTFANPVQPTDSITSLTIQSTTGLEFFETYILTLASSIVDAEGRPLGYPNTVTFYTYQPTELGSDTSTLSVLTRPVVIGNDAYVGALAGGSSVLSGADAIDITNPASPMDLGIIASASFVGRVTDAAGQANSPVAGGSSGGLLALSAGTAQDVSIPSNIWLYAVTPSPPPTPPMAPTPPQLTRVGAVSATSSATNAGVALRLSMLDQYLYASTFLQGLQVIDLNQATAEYSYYQTNNPSGFDEAISTDGEGFAMDTIVNTIPLPINTQGGTATEFGLKAAYFATAGGGTQPLIVATGALPLVVADPFAGSAGVLYPPFTSPAPGAPLTQGPLQMTIGTSVYSLSNGVAVDVGTIPVNVNGTTVNKQIAVLVGSGSVNGAGAPMLAVVGISQPYVPGSQPPYTPASPYLPQPIGFLALSASPTDVVLDGTMALVGTGSNVLVVDLTNPYDPVSGGQITGSFGTRLALDTNGILIAAGNVSSVTGPNSTLQTTSVSGLAIQVTRTSLNATSATGTPTPGGNPAFTYSAVPVAGASTASYSTAAPNANPNTGSIKAPPNPTPNGVPSPGGLATLTVTYQPQVGANASKSFNVPTFGLSCYYLASENDFLDANGNCTVPLNLGGVRYVGVTANPTGLPAGNYCTAFIRDIQLQGSGYTRNGTMVKYVSGTYPNATFAVVANFTGKDGTPLIPNGSCARDPQIIPLYSNTTVQTESGSYLANDIGSAIQGYRLDVFGGAGVAACTNYPNPINVSACNPANGNCPGLGIK
ncbi:MAG: Ig-like domain-containing protein [Candidatus Sulfotelmatobacter sp.]